MYTCPPSIKGRMKRKKNVSNKVAMWLPSTSASAMINTLVIAQL